uniref:Elongation factor Ts, mitochondrial n=1 Tax=Gronococcus sybilensis TaxID=3028029 RepID=A0A9Y1I2L0_9RHOD|nr:elongation factor Ts [Gronococcus sybilensis]
MQISSQVVKELRDKTGAGMMDCKRALQSCSGDVEKAQEELRKKGLAFAEKKMDKMAGEGTIESYIHIGGRIGILVEVNCETDFVAKREEFQQIAKDIAMQIAACPDVQYIQTSDIPQSVLDKEDEIESQKEDLKEKPEDIKKQIVQGRINKRLKEMSLLEQQYIKNTEITVEEFIKRNIATMGENIQVRRFVRFILGEGMEKIEYTFNEEVKKMLQN